MEIKETNELNEQDNISALCDDLLLHILSFLDMSSVIQMSLLSKRWKTLWRCMYVLRFEQAAFERCPQMVAKGSFEEFVQWVLKERNDCNIDTFDIYCTSQNTNLIFSWISSVLKRHVRHLSIFFLAKQNDVLPEAVFKCVSLKSLRVPDSNLTGLYRRGGGLGIPMGVNYCGLTILELNECRFPDCKGKEDVLVLNFPVLEELRLGNCELVQEFTILAPKLKIFEFSQHYDHVGGWHISLYMPCLELFMCYDFTECEQKFFFLCDLPALIKAHISTSMGVYDDFLEEYADPAFRLLEHMHNAKELDLLGGQLVDILSQSAQLNNRPTARYNFSSLKLTIMRTEKSAYTLFYILSASPNIEYLEVELKEVPGWFAYLVEDPNSQSMVVNLLDYCSMERLKVIKIRNVKDLEYDSELTSDLMTISEKLQHLIVCLDSEDYNEVLCNGISTYLNEHKRESVMIVLQSN